LLVCVSACSAVIAAALVLMLLMVAPWNQGTELVTNAARFHKGGRTALRTRLPWSAELGASVNIELSVSSRCPMRCLPARSDAERKTLDSGPRDTAESPTVAITRVVRAQPPL
jgi:hypothetical protein